MLRTGQLTRQTMLLGVYCFLCSVTAVTQNESMRWAHIGIARIKTRSVMETKGSGVILVLFCQGQSSLPVCLVAKFAAG
jgi:hypothetical protein